MMYATYLFMILGLQPSLNGPRPLPAPLVCGAAPAGLFAPPHPVMGRYEVCTTASPIDTVIAAGEAHYDAVEAAGPLDAFGSGGAYNRSMMSRLYGGMRAKVARGWQESADRFMSVTLISPYPDPTLQRLIAGTMEIRWTMTQPTDHHGTTKDAKVTKAIREAAQRRFDGVASRRARPDSR
jgi:hypothetical protein